MTAAAACFYVPWIEKTQEKSLLKKKKVPEVETSQLPSNLAAQEKGRMRLKRDTIFKDLVKLTET